MNEEGFMVLTDIDIERCQTAKGSFVARVVSLLGEDMAQKGWRKRLRGKRIARIYYAEALAVANLPRLNNIPYGEAEGQQALFP